MGMDADEELLAESVPALRAAMENPKALGYLVTLRNLDDADRPEVFTEMHSMRLMRRLPHVRFVGRIHEHLEPPINALVAATGQRILRADIYLRHTGFVQALKKQKLLRAARLLEMELRDRPGQLYYMIEHGRTLIQLGDMSGAEVLAEAGRMVWAQREAARAPIPSVALLLEFALLGAGQGIQRGPIGEEEAVYLAEKWFPASAPLAWMRGNRLFARAEYSRAARCFEMLIAMGRSGTYDRSINFDPRILRGDAVLNLGACFVELKDYARAEVCFRQIVGDLKVGEAARKNLEIVLKFKAGESRN